VSEMERDAEAVLPCVPLLSCLGREEGRKEGKRKKQKRDQPTNERGREESRNEHYTDRCLRTRLGINDGMVAMWAVVGACAS